MAQEYQRQHRTAQQAGMEQSALIEKLSSALVQVTQEKKDAGLVDDVQMDDESTIDLMELFFRVLSKIHYVILAALVGTLLAGLYVQYRVVPVYQATSTLYIVNSSGLQVSVSDLQVASTLTQDYQRIFKAWELHELVIDALDLDYSYSQMAGMVSISNPSDTRMLDIVVRHTDPELAARIANEYANQAKTFIQSTMEGEEPNVVSRALTPTSPVGMGKSRYMMLGFMIGGMLVVAVIVLQFLLDDRPHTPDDITKTAGIPTLAVVPREQNIAKSRRKVRKHRKEGKA